MRIVLYKNRFQNDNWIVGDFTVIILCVLIVICEIPIWSRNVPNVIFYGLVAVFFLSSLSFFLKKDNAKKIAILFILLYLVLIAIYKILKISSAHISYYSTITKSLFFAVVMLGIIDHLTFKQKCLIITVVVCSICFALVDNVRLFFLYGPARFATLFLSERFTSDAVNTAYVYALLFFSCALFLYFRFSRKNKTKILRLGALFLAVAVVLFDIVIAQRAAALILAVLLYSLLFLFSSGKKRKQIILFLVFICIVVAFFLFYDPFLRWLSNTVSSARLRFRLNEIRLLFASGSIDEAGGSLSGRFNLNMQSIRTAFSSVPAFIFGSGDHRSGYDIIGNHSYFIDEFARYGVVGMFIWIPMFKCILRQMKNSSQTQDDPELRRLLSVILFVYIVRGITGGILDAAISIQMFVFIPIVFSIIAKRNESDEGRLAKEG